MNQNPGSLKDLAHTRGVSRESLKHRAYTLVDPDGHQQISQTSRLTSLNTNLAFVFTGQGAQWPGMGRELMALKVFRDIILTMSKALERLDEGVSWCLSGMWLKSRGEQESNGGG